MELTSEERMAESVAMPVHKRIIIAGIVSIAYLILSYFIIGFRPEQIFISGLFFVLYTARKSTRNFLLTLLPFIIFWVIFDYMKAVPNYKFNEVHIQDLYELEKSLFGISYEGSLLTLNEFWALHRTVFLDVICGLFYLCWMPVPIAFATYLFVKDRKASVEFCWTFLLTNFVGFIGYYGYPAAPPWYIAEHVGGFDPATPGNVAGLAGFDNFFGIPVFHGLYTKSSNVFAAMPSLHAAYVVVSVFYAYTSKRVSRGWKIFLIVVMLGTWFAAVYTNHHYLMDVLVGILTAIIGVALFRIALKMLPGFAGAINKYYQQVK